MFINEEGTLKVVRHNDLSDLLKQLRPEDVEPHHVATGENCNFLSQCIEKDEATFNHILKGLFVILLCLSVAGTLIGSYFYSVFWIDTSDYVWLLVRIFVAAVIAVGILLKKRRKCGGSAPQKMEEVQTTSALVQQV